MQWQPDSAICLREEESGLEKSNSAPLQLDAHPTAPGLPSLTDCAAADGPDHVSLRAAQYPPTVIEDMEGFAATVACHLANLPLTAPPR